MGFESLRMGGAKRAIRNLFRRAGGPGDEKGSLPAAAGSGSLVCADHGPLSDQPLSDHQQDDASLSSDQDYASPSPNHQEDDPSPPSDQREDYAGQKEIESQTTTSPTNDSSMAPTVVSGRPQHQGENKENQPLANNVDFSSKKLGALKLDEQNTSPTKLAKPEPAPAVKSEPEPEPEPEPEEAESLPDMSMFNDPVIMAERAMHLGFINQALNMARLALKTNETPVGCVLVHDGKVIARGMNATNVTRNGTRHAEFMAISALLSYPPRDSPAIPPLIGPSNAPKPERDVSDMASETNSNANSNANSDGMDFEQLFPDEDNDNKGHLYPYGQKLHPDARVSASIIRECTLYVTVEPCVMCASFLRQLGIKKVYFGAVNDKFGGTGGVFSIHANSLPVSADGQTASAHPQPKPIQYPDGGGSLGTSFPPGGGDGGNVEPGYEIEGGWGRDEAVGLLRRFYVQENGRAPVPRKKEGRAARLAAMMERDGLGAASESVEEQEHENDEDDEDKEDEDDGQDHDDIDGEHSGDADSEIAGFGEGISDKENMDPRGEDKAVKARRMDEQVEGF